MSLARESSGPVLSSTDDEEYGRRRRRVFALAGGAVLVIGLIYTLLQPAVFEASATVLMSAPTAIDEQMLEADVQGVAIQRRTLTGGEIARAVSQTLEDNYGTTISALELRSLLQVEPVPETNLLELSARGSDGSLLPPLVETWIEVYTAARASDIEDRKSRTLDEVQGELDGLAGKLEAARSALEDYRAEHEIISMERQENEVLARLDGLNSALNTAIEEEVTAKAYLDTLRASLEAGEQVVPENERGEVGAMAQQLAELRSRLGELRARYTDDYILKDPRMREIPAQILELETALGEAYADGTQAELANAERNYRAARESVRDLQARLDEHKAAVSEFNTIYATHEALVEDLARLEELNRETQARQVQIEVRQLEKYPQISVIDWPAPDAVRIGPPYLLLLGGTLIGATLAGIFGVWLFSYLNPRSQQPAFVTLSGVHMYPQDGVEALTQGARVAALAEDSTQRIAYDAKAEDAPDSEPEDTGPTSEVDPSAETEAQADEGDSADAESGDDSSVERKDA